MWNLVCQYNEHVLGTMLYFAPKVTQKLMITLPHQWKLATKMPWISIFEHLCMINHCHPPTCIFLWARATTSISAYYGIIKATYQQQSAAMTRYCQCVAKQWEPTIWTLTSSQNCYCCSNEIFSPRENYC